MIAPYYQDDYATIYHCEFEALAFSLPRFDLLMADPPYGIGFASQPTKWQRRAGQKSERWDDAPMPDDSISLARRLAKTCIIWGGNYFTLPPSRCWLSWVKPDAPPSMGNVEYAWTNMDQNSRAIVHSISATNAERVGHPNQKPERVISWAIQQAGDAATILDITMGSGTTLRVAKNLCKACVGIDRDERYCEMAALRLQQEVLSL